MHILAAAQEVSSEEEGGQRSSDSKLTTPVDTGVGLADALKQVDRAHRTGINTLRATGGIA